MRHRATTADAGQRLDVWLAARSPDTSRSQVRHWFDEGRVTVDGHAVKSGHAVRAGELIDWEPPAPGHRTDGEPPAEDNPVVIVHEDPAFVVVDKPPGMVVHPGAGVFTGTLVGALKGMGYELAPLGGPHRPGIVHRLDRGTSGLLVVARTDSAYRSLVRMIAARQIHRGYRALVWGDPAGNDGVLEAAITRSRADRRRMTVARSGGRSAITRWSVRRRYGLFTDLDLQLETGRTHQIRVHCRHMGHPVFGDSVYAGRSRGGDLPSSERAEIRHLLSLVDRQALHAARLRFDHPLGGGHLEFEAPLPDDMARLYGALDRGFAARRAPAEGQ
jgi:23S rRNA pseudouridine1911/1915/1917 synthase